jgi:hypothetical protein
MMRTFKADLSSSPAAAACVSDAHTANTKTITMPADGPAVGIDLGTTYS